MRWAIKNCRTCLIKDLLRHNVEGVEDNGTWPLLNKLAQFKPPPVEIMNIVLQHALDLGPTRSTRPAQMTCTLGWYLTKGSVGSLIFSRKCGHRGSCECEWPVSEEELKVVKLLLRLGADPNGFYKTSPGLQPRRLISYCRNERILDLLIDNGADIPF